MEQDPTFRKRYRLAPGTQVRDEDFGLLFYTMDGPRLFFLSSGKLLGSSFFQGHHTLGQWMEQHIKDRSITESLKLDLAKNLDRLIDKEVILEY